MPRTESPCRNAAVPHGMPGLLAMPLSRLKVLHRVRQSISLTDGLPMSLTRKRTAVRALVATISEFEVSDVADGEDEETAAERDSE